jgi:hypothetical protein
MTAEEPMMTNFELQETEVEHKLAEMLIEQIFNEATEDIQKAFSI